MMPYWGAILGPLRRGRMAGATPGMSASAIYRDTPSAETLPAVTVGQGPTPGASEFWNVRARIVGNTAGRRKIF